MYKSDNKPGYFATITAEVRYCKDLEPNAKLLYGEITALANMHGYCWASNEYFSRLYEVDERTIRRWLESLRDKGFIFIELIKDGLKSIRHIWISKEIKEKFASGQKCPPRPDKNVRLERTKMSSIIRQDINNTDDDDAREPADLSAIVESEKSIPEQIKYRSPSGIEKIVSKNEIFRRFIRKPYKTQTLIDAIKRLMERNDMIGDVIKYLEAICAQIESNDRPIAKTERKPKKTMAESIPMPKEDQVFAPGCGEGGWYEIEKKLKEKLKSD